MFKRAQLPVVILKDIESWRRLSKSRLQSYMYALDTTITHVRARTHTHTHTHK